MANMILEPKKKGIKSAVTTKKTKKDLFHQQYSIYGQYVIQEEQDIDQAIKTLSRFYKVAR